MSTSGEHDESRKLRRFAEFGGDSLSEDTPPSEGLEELYSRHCSSSFSRERRLSFLDSRSRLLLSCSCSTDSCLEKKFQCYYRATCCVMLPPPCWKKDRSCPPPRDFPLRGVVEWMKEYHCHWPRRKDEKIFKNKITIKPFLPFNFGFVFHNK